MSEWPLLNRWLDITLGPPRNADETAGEDCMSRWGKEWDGTFVIGDVVRLRGGGPPMTVERIEGDYISTCWFVGFEPNRSTFEPAHLLMVTPMERAAAA